ncbi:uncharacterized protein N7484_009166 [Penicillium longicatenatum]|uniref:uncharacterized protein n=1 Tax=Penicillium longicatenatum TaxID=1561947 RepID=UPI0025484433|nr:uncharacterized protein N7484_009166 [Penicillium longicatenatum]KAJ5635853.1 hypothetical protein N7484_009166 [Penicillium longicatenatum]
MSRPSSARLPVGNKDFTQATVVIIGAGISGMCMAIDLIKRNKCRNFVILEKGSSVGGTWNDNKYPGCCCDVWSTLYSYSFEQNPNWTRDYPGQEELHAYLVRTAEKYGLYKHIRFNSTVEEARWNDTECKWEVGVKVTGQKDSEFADSYTINSQFLISAVGQLNAPQEPNIPCLHEFQGKMMHTARWDWSYDLKNKRVAIIGNGATAAQIVPEIVTEVSHLTIFQRTPNWVTPRLDAPVSPLQQALLTYIPPLRWRKRSLQMDYRETFHGAIFDNDSAFAQGLRDSSTNHLKAQLADHPELWDKLTPNYAPGCKRVIISDDYYPALARDNVNLETRPITRITERGIEVDGDGEQEYDLIILATGFKTVEFMYPIKVFGANGRPLEEIWKDGARAYRGVTVEDLPNFGMFYGPNTNLGHNSIILMIEAQSRYLNGLVAEVMRAKQQGQKLSLKPTPEAMKEFNDKIQAILRDSSFADPNCNSWYKRADGVITNNWCGTVIEYQGELSQIQWEDYISDGSGKDLMTNKRPTNLGRVREESFFTNMSLLIGTFGALAIAGGYLATRPKLLRSR